MIAHILTGALLPSGWLGKPVDDIAEENDLSRDDVARFWPACRNLSRPAFSPRVLLIACACRRAKPACLTRRLKCCWIIWNCWRRAKSTSWRADAKPRLEGVRVMLRRIRQFDPKPAETFFGEAEIVNAPDLIAYRGPDGWVVELNKSTLPGITIDEHYAARLKTRVAEQAEQKFTMQALSSARWLKRPCNSAMRRHWQSPPKSSANKRNFSKKGPIT